MDPEREQTKESAGGRPPWANGRGGIQRAATAAAIAAAIGVTATIGWGLVDRALGPNVRSDIQRQVFASYRRMRSRLRARLPA
jgi:hypothetical protein